MAHKIKLIVIDRLRETRFGVSIETAKLKVPFKAVKLEAVLAPSRPSLLTLPYRGVQFSALND
jgi:hypothetical protein